MAITQKRIRELTQYTQLDSGEPGYVNPSSLFLALDSASFGSEALKYPAESFFSDIHVEKGRITSPGSRVVSVIFDDAFVAAPIPLLFDVFRYTAVDTGKYIRDNVLYYVSGATWATTTGFDITIDDSESLTGVYIEYYFVEA